MLFWFQLEGPWEISVHKSDSTADQMLRSFVIIWIFLIISPNSYTVLLTRVKDVRVSSRGLYLFNSSAHVFVYQRASSPNSLTSALLAIACQSALTFPADIEGKLCIK